MELTKPETVRPGRTSNTGVDDDGRQALRAEGLDPDDPAVIGAINLVRWELSSALELPHPPDRSPKPNRSAAHNSTQMNCPAFCDIGPLSGPQDCPPYMARPGSIRNQVTDLASWCPLQTGIGILALVQYVKGPGKK